MCGHGFYRNFGRRAGTTSFLCVLGATSCMYMGRQTCPDSQRPAAMYRQAPWRGYWQMSWNNIWRLWSHPAKWVLMAGLLSSTRCCSTCGNASSECCMLHLDINLQLRSDTGTWAVWVHCKDRHTHSCINAVLALCFLACHAAVDWDVPPQITMSAQHSHEHPLKIIASQRLHFLTF